MKVYQFAVRLLGMLMLFVCGSTGNLYADPGLKEIRYVNGSIVDSVLPYDEPFAIKGSAITATGDTASYVVININKAPGTNGCMSCRSNEPYAEEYYWKREGKAAEFYVIVGRPLELDEEYNVDVRLVINQKNPPALMQLLYVPLAKQYKDNQFLSDVNTRALLQKKVDSVNIADASKYAFKNPELKHIGDIRLGPGAATFADHMNQIVAMTPQLQTKTDSLNELKERKKRRIEIFRADSLQNDTELKVAETIHAVKKRKEAVSVAKRKIFLCDSLFKGDTIDLSRQIALKQKEVAETKLIMGEATAEIDALYSGAFSATGIAYLISINLIEFHCGLNKTKSDEVRIHTDYGMAYTSFNGSLKYGQTFGYWGAKVYFCQVDKSAFHPYRNHFYRRFSLVIGSVLPNKLSYKGQALGNVNFLNLKPVLAVGFDVNKFIGINLGTVVFTQPDPNPLIKQTYTVFAAFASISIDLNLINRLKNFTNP